MNPARIPRALGTAIHEFRVARAVVRWVPLSSQRMNLTRVQRVRGGMNRALTLYVDLVYTGIPRKHGSLCTAGIPRKCPPSRKSHVRACVFVPAQRTPLSPQWLKLLLRFESYEYKL